MPTVNVSMRKLIVILLVSLLCAASGDAGEITWDPPQNSSGPGDVSTEGTLVEAFNLTDAALVPGTTTVNGVTFTHDDTLFGLLGGVGLLDGNTSGDADYDALLDSVDHGNTAVADPWVIQVGGNLQVGETYTLQLWYTDLRSFATGFTQIYDDGNGNTVTLDSDSGGLGQFVIGTFIADGPNQTLVIDNGDPPGEPHLNAYQVRSQKEGAAVITETDNDTWVWEDGTASDTYTIVLTSQPTSSVTITVDPDVDTEVNGNSAGNTDSLTFTTGNWDTPQTVTVDGIEDAIDPDGIEISTIGHTSSSTDPNYNGLSIPSVSVEVIDSANQYYDGFVLYGFWGSDPFILQRCTHWHCSYNAFTPAGDIVYDDSGYVAGVDKAHRYGAKAIIGFDTDSDWGAMMDNADGSRGNFVSQLTQWLIDAGADGVDFDHENGPFGPDYDALIVDCASAFAPHGFTVGADVYIGRAELSSTGLGAIDHLNLMDYCGLGSGINMINYWKGRGASDGTIMLGMANGWAGDCDSDNYGFRQEIAIAKTRFALDSGYAGVWQFRSDLDTLNVNTSLLEACSSTILNYNSDGVDVTWDGGGDGTNWSSANNWNPDVVPRANDDVIIDAPGTTIVGDELGVTEVFDTLDLQAGTLQCDMYYGYSDSKGLTISGGTLEAGFFQVGRQYDATLTQTGGSVIGGGSLILGESPGFTGYGTYNMNGGTLDIDGTITETNGEFNFTGGTITLNGNKVGFNSANSWFVVSGASCTTYTETYNFGSNTTTLDLSVTYDLDGDGKVTLADYAIFAEDFGIGNADLIDLHEFCSCWLTSIP